MKIIAIIRKGKTIVGTGKERDPAPIIRGIMIVVDVQTLANNLHKEKITRKRIRSQITKKWLSLIDSINRLTSK